VDTEDEDCIFTLEKFRYGLRCMDCKYRFEQPGERYVRRLSSMTEFMGEAAFIVEIVCVPCGLKSTAQP